jgi:hypothetical protein
LANGFQCHVAGSLYSPFVVLFEQDGADEADDGVVVGKDPTTSVRRLISPLRRSIGLVLWSLTRCSLGKVM